jgi:hypothetical protein
MKRSSTIFLQIVIVLFGVGTLVFMLWEPHLEGRNANATTFEIYFNDPFLAYVYLASISFFVALYQAFKVLGDVRQDRTFSQGTVRALRTIRICAMILAVSIVGALAFILIVSRRVEEDIAGGVAMCLFMLFSTVVVGTAANVAERLLQNAVDLKSENDLTV